MIFQQRNGKRGIGGHDRDEKTFGTRTGLWCLVLVGLWGVLMPTVASANQGSGRMGAYVGGQLGTSMMLVGPGGQFDVRNAAEQDRHPSSGIGLLGSAHLGGALINNDELMLGLQFGPSFLPVGKHGGLEPLLEFMLLVNTNRYGIAGLGFDVRIGENQSEEGGQPNELVFFKAQTMFPWSISDDFDAYPLVGVSIGGDKQSGFRTYVFMEVRLDWWMLKSGRSKRKTLPSTPIKAGGV